MVEFKILVGGRWLSVDPDTGGVAGWTQTRWVSLRGGALREEPRGRVVRGLRALLAGRPGVVRVGAPLPRRSAKHKPSRRRHAAHCTRYRRYSKGPNLTNLLQRDASVQTDTQTGQHHQEPRPRGPRHNNNNTENISKAKHIESPTKQRKHGMSTDSDQSSDEDAPSRNKKTFKPHTQNKQTGPISSDTDKTNLLKERVKNNIAKIFKKPNGSPKKHVMQKISTTDSKPNENVPTHLSLKRNKNGWFIKRATSLTKKNNKEMDRKDLNEYQNENEQISQKKVKHLQKKTRMEKKSNSDSEFQIENEQIRPKKINNQQKKSPEKKISAHFSSDSEFQNENEGSAQKKVNQQNKSRKKEKSSYISSDNEPMSKHKELVRRRVLQELSSDTNEFEERSIIRRHRLKNSDMSYLRKPNKQNIIHISTDSESETSDNHVTTKKRRVRASDSKMTHTIFEGKLPQYTDSNGDYKELIIDEEDVILLRKFIERHCPSIDLYKFDCHDEYKQEIFYRINPVVRLERCTRISHELSERARRDFAEQLGLRSVTSSDGDVEVRRPLRKSRRSNKDRTSEKPQLDKDRTNEKILRREKEKTREKIQQGDRDRMSLKIHQREEDRTSDKTQQRDKDRMNVKTIQREKDRTNEESLQKEKDRTSEKTQGSDKDSKENKQIVKGMRPVVVPKRSSVPAGREYSSLEDHSIVAWVSAEPSRERAVNGNRIWKTFQGSYSAITGQQRTWHSLRNRYLRYILPALGALALAPQQVARLRAAAATGELKARNKSSREASILRAPPLLRSAFSRRPPPPRPRSPPAREPSPPCTLRSSAAVPPSHPARPPGPRPARSPRYSDVTRRFALTHTSTPNDAVDRAAPGLGPRTRRLYNPGRL